MGSVNRVVILGNIGQTPELKWTRNGKPFVHLSLSTHKRFKDHEGNDRRETQWHKVMIWGKNAENCAIYCEKGSPLYIEGHLAPYIKKENGVTSYHISIVADQMQFIPGSKTAVTAERNEFGSEFTASSAPPITDEPFLENQGPQTAETANTLN